MENNITVADLNLLKNIIDLASTRGAFRAGEMKEIGEVYNKLSQFLEAVVAQAAAQEADTAEADESDEASVPQGE
jgi:hypothetical protein